MDIKMLFVSDKEHDLNHDALHVTDDLRGHAFFVSQPDPVSGRLVRYATPLFLALVLIEVADLVFPVDSVPAVFTITTDPYIVYR